MSDDKEKKDKNKLKKQLEESNRLKYGDKEHDQISENYRIGKEHGDIWCAENIKRYLNRFKRPKSSKANNLTDLYKAKDYLERMIEANEELATDPENGITTQEIEENFKK
jgi:hypothetical protein